MKRKPISEILKAKGMTIKQLIDARLHWVADTAPIDISDEIYHLLDSPEYKAFAKEGK